MLEQWVIEQLNPLKAERLIILGDPQRMIRAGAQAVDGWAKENGFTVLFCSGNLALREMYENLRDDTKLAWLVARFAGHAAQSRGRIQRRGLLVAPSG
jgi:hypothetical protein